MKRLTIVLLGALALSGCTGTRIKPAAVCDGKHRRPANLYGSVLPSLPLPLPASQQRAGQSAVAPPSGATTQDPAPAAVPAPVPAPAPATGPGPGPGPAPAPSPAPASVPGSPPILRLDTDGLLDEPAAPTAPAARTVSPAAPRLSRRDGALIYSSC